MKEIKHCPNLLGIKPKQGHGALITILIVLYSIGLFSVLFYFFQHTPPEEVAQTAQNTDDRNSAELNKLRAENEGLKQQLTTSYQQTKDITLPVVAFGRPGLLSQTDTAALDRFLINPYIDYHKNDENSLISLFVTAPQNTGEAYDVIAVFEDGYEGFLYGKKGEEFDWWLPTCMDSCELTEEFRILYPSIAERVQ